ncbi:MAG: type II secretion system protein N [Gammaproteobacteria bacterium]|nr:type II secretion system protein N [Gammaproteobacteria bacterium]
MKTKNIFIAGAISYFLFLLILTPAANIIPLLTPSSNKISLHGISGSLWSGEIDQVIFNKQKLQSLRWSLNPLSIFAASISTDLQTEYKGQSISSQLEYSLISKIITLNDLQSSIKATELQKILNLPFGQLDGEINIDLHTVDLVAGKLPLINGKISWNNAKLSLSNTISFGQLQLILHSNDTGDLFGELSNKQGELSIQGDIKILANQRYTLDIKLKPRANASTELKNILTLVAPRKVKSEHIIHRAGHLRDLGIRL